MKFSTWTFQFHGNGLSASLRRNADQIRVFVSRPERLDLGQGRRKRLGDRIEVDEYKAVPDLKLDGRQPLRFAELDGLFPTHVRRADQLAFEIVGPVVQRTAQLSSDFPRTDDLTPMTANRRHGAELSVPLSV